MDINHYYINHPTEIITASLGIPNDYRQKCIDKIYLMGDHMQQTTNVKAIMSSWKIWEQTDILNTLLKNILSLVNKSFPLQDERWEYEINSCWTAVYKKGHYSNIHEHRPSEISFVYYLQSNGSTPLVFDDCKFDTTPIDDMLVAFPSYLRHSVPKHKDEEDRICLAGNINYKLAT
tara:strand:- start:237 stop:764 length:528 start_codon:yes stop_codon:yes gene_type:complete